MKEDAMSFTSSSSQRARIWTEGWVIFINLRMISVSFILIIIMWSRRYGNSYRCYAMLGFWSLWAVSGGLGFGFLYS